jgi:hypothetical protein
MPATGTITRLRLLLPRTLSLLSTVRVAKVAGQMKSRLLIALFTFAALLALRAGHVFSTDTNNLTTVTFTNNFFKGVCTIEGRSGLRWVPLQNFWATQRIGQATFALPANYTRFRLVGTPIGPANNVRLALCYGKISTVAGQGPVPPGVNAWQTNFEGAFATEVFLSDPRNAVADDQGNIYVVEREGHAVVKITTDGRIHTLVGTHVPGAGGDAIAGTNSALLYPSAIHIAGNKLYVLDAGNSRLRFVYLNDPNAFVYPVFTDPTGIGPNSSGLWVVEGLIDGQPGPTEAFYGNGTLLKHWEDGTLGVETNGSGFGELRSVVVNPRGRTIVADPVNHRVYRVRGNGNWVDEVQAGTGFAIGNQLGGPADKVALPGASGVAYLPIGGYFVALDRGAKVWYVDEEDNAAPFIFGRPGVLAGDGRWFRSGGRAPKIGNIRSISLAPDGDIILVQSDGFIRKVNFLRAIP